MYMTGSPAEIQIQAHWNLIGRSSTAPPHVIAQQYSSATFVLLLHHFRNGNDSACFENVFYLSCSFNVS
jgi:hypothetical protein